MQEHQVIIFGKHAAISAIQNSDREIYKIFICQERGPEYTPLIPKKFTKKIEFCIAKKISKICSGNAVHQGIAVITEKLHQKNLRQLIEQSKTKEKSLVIVLDKVTDPFNVGSILRSSKAFGVDFLITQEKHSPSETSIIAKTASGALESVPICKAINLSTAIDMLQENNYFCYGLDGGSKTLITDIKLPKKTVIILGAEGSGIRHLIKLKCDKIIKIPMSTAQNFDSINVTNAGAIAMFKFFSEHF